MSKVFSEKDYNSGSGMLTTIWGPGLWHALHCISVNFPVKPTKKEKQYYKTFILSLQHVLPCKYCRDNFETNLKTTPLNSKALSNRKEFSKWMFEFHQTVNKCLGKTNNLTHNVIRERYEHFRARCNSTGKKHKGCTESIYGVKSKCLLRIVPKKDKQVTFKIQKDCKKKRINK